MHGVKSSGIVHCRGLYPFIPYAVNVGKETTRSLHGMGTSVFLRLLTISGNTDFHAMLKVARHVDFTSLVENQVWESRNTPLIHIE